VEDENIQKGLEFCKIFSELRGYGEFFRNRTGIKGNGFDSIMVADEQCPLIVEFLGYDCEFILSKHFFCILPLNPGF